MKIALVWPFGFDVKYVMPLALGYLKSNLGNKHDTRIIDCSLNGIKADSHEFSKILQDFKPDLVCVSCWSSTYKEAVQVLKVAKKLDSNVITVMGGAHATTYSHHIITHEKSIDFIFRGEAELSFAKFVEELESGKKNFSQVKGLTYMGQDGFVVQNDMERLTNLDKIKIPDYKAMNLQEYLKRGYKLSTTKSRNAPIWVTRGCPYKCQFCSASILNGRIVRMHSIGYVIEWIRYLRDEEKINHINIIDDNFTFNLNFAKEFCRSLINAKLGVAMGTPNGIRMQRLDDELCMLMKKAGWESVIIAPESGSERVLKKMKKDIDPKSIPRVIKMIKNHGLKVHGFFILGYPGETKKDLEQTLKMLRQYDLDFFTLNNFQPIPGTPVFNELVENGEITADLLPKDYSDGERAYVPKEMGDVNFPKVILAEYLRLCLRKPRNLPYTLKIFSPQLVAKKVFRNLKNSFIKSKVERHENSA
jgi:radical SAM superfamily enzyme YgiQ (UPF0313 family)